MPMYFDIGIAKLYPKKSTKVLRAVRLFCGECMGMSRTVKRISIPHELIRDCTDEMCPLFEWRFGKNPYAKIRVTKKSLAALKKGRKIRGKPKV